MTLVAIGGEADNVFDIDEFEELDGELDYTARRTYHVDVPRRVLYVGALSQHLMSELASNKQGHLDDVISFEVRECPTLGT